MFNRTTLRKFIAPRRQAREVIHLLILRTLGAPSTSLRTCFAGVAGVSDCIVPNGFINFKYVWLDFDNSKQLCGYEFSSAKLRQSR